MKIFDFFKKNKSDDSEKLVCIRCKQRIHGRPARHTGNLEPVCKECVEFVACSVECRLKDSDSAFVVAAGSSNLVMCMKNEKTSCMCRNGENPVERWTYWREKLPGYFAARNHVGLEFLKEILDVASDRYSGTDRIYYFKKEDRTFYTRISHWDGGNMFANRSGEETALSRDALIGVVTNEKNKIMESMSQPERDDFEKVANDVLEILLKQLPCTPDNRLTPRR